MQYKQELAIVRKQQVDISNFEDKLLSFKDKIAYNYKQADKKFNTAIDEIDKAIASLENTKKALLGSVNNLRIASEKADGITIRKLTHGNPTIKALFEGDKWQAAADFESVFNELKK